MNGSKKESKPANLHMRNGSKVNLVGLDHPDMDSITKSKEPMRVIYQRDDGEDIETVMFVRIEEERTQE